MKKINSNGYSGKILMVTIVFLLIIPIVMRVAHIIYPLGAFILCRKISFVIGVLFAVGFILMLGMEFHQDSYLEEYYTLHKRVKIDLGSGNFECQNCGNRNVKEQDQQCNVCGIVLDGKTKKYGKFQHKKYHGY